MIDDFNFHIVPDKTQFYHKDLIKLINSLEEKDKRELEKYTINVKRIYNKTKEFKRNIKIVWGGVYEGLPDNLNLSNLLTHIDADKRESLDLIEPDDIKDGFLKYCGHNLNDKSRACVYSILLKYISILDRKAIKLYKY